MSSIENQTPGPVRRLGGRLVAAAMVVALITAGAYAIHAVSHSSGYDAGYAAGQRTGDAAGERTGEASGERRGEAAGKRAGEIAGRRAGERIGEQTGERVGFERGRTVGFARGETQGAAAGAEAALGGFGEWTGAGYYVVTVEPGGQPGVPYRIATRTALRPLTNYRLCESDGDRLCALPVVVASGG